MLIYRTGLEIHNAAGDPDENSKYQLASVQITPDGKLLATNGHQALRVSALANKPDLFTENAVGAVHGEPLDGPITIPADVIKAFLAASKKKKGQNKEPQIVVTSKDGAVTLATADGKTKRTFVIEEDQTPFPAIDRVIRKTAPAETILFNVDEAILLFSTMRRLGATCVEVGYYEPLAPLRVSATSYAADTEMAIEGSIMPMTPADRDDAGKRDEEPRHVDTATGEMFDGVSPVAAVMDSLTAAASDIAGDTPGATFARKMQRQAKKDGSSVTVSAGGRSVTIDAVGAHVG